MPAKYNKDQVRAAFEKVFNGCDLNRTSDGLYRNVHVQISWDKVFRCVTELGAVEGANV